MGIGVGIFVPSVPFLTGGGGAVRGYQSSVLGDGGTVVAIGNTTDLYSRLLGLGLINSASLVNSCNGGKADALYNFVPSPVQSLDRFVVTRASTKLRIGSNGLYGSVANNVPAFEFNTDGTYRGLLVEPGATNLLLRSQEFEHASWITNTTRPTITADATTSPDGTTNADRMVITAAGGFQGIYQDTTVTSGIAYTFSIWVKNNTGSGKLRIWVDASGASTTPLEITPTANWVRYSVTSTTGDTSARVQIANSNPATDLDCFIWQAQLETGSVATSPIVTTAGTASRVADVVSLTGASSLIGQQEGSVYAEVNITNYGGATDSIFTISDGTITNRIEVNKRSGATLALERASTTQSGATTISSGAMGLGVMRIAIAYKTGDTVLFINGVQIGSTALQTFTMSAIDRIFLGSNATGGTRYWNSNIRALAVFPTRLANATLAVLTQ